MYALASLPEPIAHFRLALSTLSDRISYVSVRAADQVDADQNSTPTPAPMAIRERLGPYLTTLPMCRRRRSSAAPLGRIGYNVGILSPSPSYERLAVASQPCLLTPAQAVLAAARAWHGSGACACAAFVAAVLVCWHVSLVQCTHDWDCRGYPVSCMYVILEKCDM